MNQKINVRYSTEQLHQIADEAMIYLCACPAQVANQLLLLRDLHQYQQHCLNTGSLSEQVHQCISFATQEAHDRLEQCLDDILTLEGWNKTTMKMPKGLRQIRDLAIVGAAE